VIGELGGVREQIEEGLPDFRQVGVHRADVVGAGDDQGVAVLVDQRLDDVGDVADQLGDVELFEVEVHPAGLDLREVQDVVDEPEQVLAGRVDPLEIGQEGVGVELLGLLLEHLGVADDRVQGRAQLVRHVGQEVGLVLAGDFQLTAFLLDLLEKEGVLDGELRLARQHREQPDDRRGERAGGLAANHQHADDAIVADQRHGDEGAEAGAPQDVRDGRPTGLSLGLQVRGLLRLPETRRPPDDRVLVGPWWGALDRRQQLIRHQVGGSQDELVGGTVELIDGAAIGVGEAGGVRDDGGEDFLEVEGGGDGLADLAERPQLFDGAGELGGALLKLLEQPGILDGDDGLVGKCLQQRDLLIGERTGKVLDQDDRADGDAFAQQGHGESGARLVCRRHVGELGCVDLVHVRDMNGLSVDDGSPHGRSTTDRQEVSDLESGRMGRLTGVGYDS
jgi:hypothetical protein